jgi:hypothetical protein
LQREFFGKKMSFADECAFEALTSKLSGVLFRDQPQARYPSPHVAGLLRASSLVSILRSGDASSTGRENAVRPRTLTAAWAMLKRMPASHDLLANLPIFAAVSGWKLANFMDCAWPTLATCSEIDSWQQLPMRECRKRGRGSKPLGGQLS